MESQCDVLVTASTGIGSWFVRQTVSCHVHRCSCTRRRWLLASRCCPSATVPRCATSTQSQSTSTVIRWVTVLTLTLTLSLTLPLTLNMQR